MLTRLSSKGQLVIPKVIRDSLGLEAGTQFYLQVGDGKIVLEPIASSPVEALYGKYTDLDLISDLEAEHRQEIENDN